jgi:hypothetical protein
VRINFLFFIEHLLVQQCPECKKAIRRVLSVFLWADRPDFMNPKVMSELGLGSSEITVMEKESFFYRKSRYFININMPCEGRITLEARGNTISNVEVDCG